MPYVPNSLVCRACQSLRHFGHAKITLWHDLNAQGSSLNIAAILRLAKKKLNRSPCLFFDVKVIGHLHDDVIAIPFIFINLVNLREV